MARRDLRLLGFARQMRKDPTRGESVLWSHLRRRQFGVRFRRQEPIGPFIVDFACLSKHLTIEIDGDTHDDPAKDARRDRWFVNRGWFVLRFWDDYVIEHTDEVLEIIQQALDEPSSVMDPLNRHA